MRTQKLHQALRMQAAWRLIEPESKGTVASVSKRYGLTERELKRAVQDLITGNFKKGSAWNPFWDKPEIIHHPVDTAVMVDIQNGSAKGSDVDLMLDPDFDAVNGMLHKEWTTNDILALCEGIPFRTLEILRDVKPGTELYNEALEMMHSDFFANCCKAFGIDSESLLVNALKITNKQHS